MMYRFSSLIAVLLALALPASAQTNPELVGSCEPGIAESYLDVGNVRARLLPNGVLFWAGSPHVYEVPKGSGVNAIFTDAIWIAGKVDGEVKGAATEYGPSEFWPGPITIPNTPPEDCSIYDQIWTLNWDEDFGNSQTRGETQNVREWPTMLGAPYLDLDGKQGYSAQDGDLPYMLGDQMHWWVMNDLGNAHNRTNSDPLGVEVQVSAFAFDVPGHIGNTTFYRYEITNRNSRPIEDAFFGRYIDADLGNFDDDAIGTDTTLSMFYFYNADNVDEGSEGYGPAPPAIGVSIIEASSSSGSLPSDVGADPGSFLTNTMFHWGSGGVQGDPYPIEEFYGYMQSRWRDGERLTEGYLGRYHSSEELNYFMPGDPVTGGFWSQLNQVNGASKPSGFDQRMLGSFGPFDLLPDESATFTFAFIWARGTSNLDSITKLREAASLVHASKAAILAPRDPNPQFIDANPAKPQEHPFWIKQPYPNPARNTSTLDYSVSLDSHVEIKIFDSLLREAAVPLSSPKTAGKHSVTLDVSRLPPGVYQIRLRQARKTLVRSLVVL